MLVSACFVIQEELTGINRYDFDVSALPVTFRYDESSVRWDIPVAVIPPRVSYREGGGWDSPQEKILIKKCDFSYNFCLKMNV